MVRILLVEDNIIQSASLSAMLSDCGYEVVEVASSGEKALLAFQKLRPDLAILDIKINGQMDGIEVGKAISKERPVPIIYLTAYAENYERAKITHPAAFFSKPYNEQDLMHAIDLAVFNYACHKNAEEVTSASSDNSTANIHFALDCIWVKTRSGHPFRRIAVEEIRWVAASNVYIEIYTTAIKQPQTVTMGISDFYRRASYPPLLRIHRSYLVNRDHIRQFNADRVVLECGAVLPISSSYRRDVLRRLKQGAV